MKTEGVNMLGNIIGVNYSQIFQQVIKDKNVREGLADFIVYCFEECVELEDAIVAKFSENKKLEKIIDDRILYLANANDTKNRFTRQLREGVQ